MNWPVPQKIIVYIIGMERFFLTIALAWVVFVVVPTIPAVRDFLGSPLVIADRDPRGDACYILADAG
jgi:hypothetical protein